MKEQTKILRYPEDFGNYQPPLLSELRSRKCNRGIVEFSFESTCSKTPSFPSASRNPSPLYEADGKNSVRKTEIPHRLFRVVMLQRKPLFSVLTTEVKQNVQNDSQQFFRTTLFKGNS